MCIHMHGERIENPIRMPSSAYKKNIENNKAFSWFIGA